MGNRAVITTVASDKLEEATQIAIYLHWNGGRDSIEGFLRYCKLKEYRPPEQSSYGWARFTQIVSNFIGGALSIGIDNFYKLDYDNYDNGIYLIKDWEIVGREYHKGEEQSEFPLLAMLEEINEAQPKKEQIDISEAIRKETEEKVKTM